MKTWKRKNWPAAMEALGWPVAGIAACTLWQISNGYPIEGNRLSYSDAAQLMRECGYIPFMGYPLQRSGKVERLTKQEIAIEKIFNPVLKEALGYPI